MRPPSGDQVGSASRAELLVRRACPEPSAFITYISLFPSRSDTNAMRRPPGDQAGSASRAELLVRRAWPEPSAFITYISLFPSRLDSNAIRPDGASQLGSRRAKRPGDQAGKESLAELLVRRVWPVPSASITYISLYPSRTDWNAIHWPSGDHAGLEPPAELLVRRVWPKPYASITYTS